MSAKKIDQLSRLLHSQIVEAEGAKTKAKAVTLLTAIANLSEKLLVMGGDKQELRFVEIEQLMTKLAKRFPELEDVPLSRYITEGE